MSYVRPFVPAEAVDAIDGQELLAPVAAQQFLARVQLTTAHRPTLQPGFEDADTSVAAAVPFYGVYDFVDEDGLHAPVMFSWVVEPLVFKARRRHDIEPFRDVVRLTVTHDQLEPDS